MTLATLAEVLQPALKNGSAVAGLVCLGWEDARAYAMAAEDEGVPVILQAGPSCRGHTPLPVLGAMLRNLAESVSVPVVVHLDHGYELDECKAAIDAGFTSIMFDGSRKPLEQNIAETAEVARLSHAAGASCEGEIGFVGYAEGEASARTDPADAARFAAETGIDAMAVSVGNVHLQQTKAAEIDIAAVQAIAATTAVPLVIHGGSGVPEAMRRQLALTTPVCKFNIGTELRMTFGDALHAAVAKDPNRFDRVSILREVEDPIRAAARPILSAISKPGG